MIEYDNHRSDHLWRQRSLVPSWNHVGAAWQGRDILRVVCGPVGTSGLDRLDECSRVLRRWQRADRVRLRHRLRLAAEPPGGVCNHRNDYLGDVGIAQLKDQ